MLQLRRYLPSLLVVLVSIPTLLIHRSVLNQDLTGADMLLILTLGAHFGLLFFMVRMSEDSTTYFSREERKGFRLMILAIYGAAALGWYGVASTGRVSIAVVVSAAAGLAFGCYDLLAIAASIPGPKPLGRLVLVHVAVPLFAGLVISFSSIAFFHAPLIINPIALFFMLRAILSVRQST